MILEQYGKWSIITIYSVGPEERHRIAQGRIQKGWYLINGKVREVTGAWHFENGSLENKELHYPIYVNSIEALLGRLPTITLEKLKPNVHS